MSKAVLVVDMPESCLNCRFYKQYGLVRWTCNLTGIISDVHVEYARYCKCPLRPLPEKLWNDKSTYCIGWNDAIEAIEGSNDD